MAKNNRFPHTYHSQVNDYECVCTNGWTGKNCEESVNECLSDPCQNFGNCVDSFNGYTCNCQAG